MSALKLATSNIGWRAEDDEAVLAHMRQLGFTGLEIAPTRVISDDPYEHLDEARAFAKRVEGEFGLELCSMQSIWRGRDENIFDPEGARELLDYTDKACKFAKASGIRNLVFGCPKNRIKPDGSSPEDAIPFITSCGQLAHASEATFAIEANPDIYGTNFLNTTAEALEFLENMPDRTGISLNLDIGTMLQEDEGADVALAAMPFVSHVHISEPHLAPVKPHPLHREIRRVLEDSGYDGFVSLEMGTADLSTVKSALEYMADTFLS